MITKNRLRKSTESAVYSLSIANNTITAIGGPNNAIKAISHLAAVHCGNGEKLKNNHCGATPTAGNKTKHKRVRHDMSRNDFAGCLPKSGWLSTVVLNLIA